MNRELKTPSVRVDINGNRYTGWSSISMDKSMDTLVGAFSLGLYNIPTNPPIGPEQEVKIYIDGVLYMTGIIDSRLRSGNSTSRTFNISGREKTRNLVDCSAEYKTGVWSGYTDIMRIVNDLCNPYGIRVVNSDHVKYSVNNFAIDQGESVHSAIDRLSRMHKIVPFTSADGNIQFSKVGESRTNGELILGQNIEDYSESLDYKDRYARYVVQSQTTGSGSYWSNAENVDTDVPIFITATAEDSVMRDVLGSKRFLFTNSSYMANAATGKRNAEWEAKVRAARSIKHTVTHIGWYDTFNTLWQLNKITRYANPEIVIEDDFLVSSVSFTLDSSGGTLAKIGLSNVNAYDPEPVKEKKPKAASSTEINYWQD